MPSLGSARPETSYFPPLLYQCPSDPGSQPCQMDLWDPSHPLLQMCVSGHCHRHSHEHSQGLLVDLQPWIPLLIPATSHLFHPHTPTPRSQAATELPSSSRCAFSMYLKQTTKTPLAGGTGGRDAGVLVVSYEDFKHVAYSFPENINDSGQQVQLTD